MPLQINEKTLSLFRKNAGNIKGIFEITSPPDSAYNCHAWAVCITKHPLDPFDKTNPWYSPEDGIAVAAMMRRYEDFFGFRDCTPNSEYEEGYDKIALYVLNGEVQHTARLKRSRLWASKLDIEVDIEHVELDCFQERGWGTPQVFMKRKRTHDEPQINSTSKWIPFHYKNLQMRGLL